MADSPSILRPWDPGPPKPRRPRWLIPAALAAAAALTVSLPPVKRRIVNLVDRLRRERVVIKKEIVEKIVEKRIEVPVPAPPPPLPEGPSLGSKRDAATMFSGLQIVSNVEPTKGQRATTERAAADSYKVEVTVRVRVPEPATSFEHLCGINPALPQFFPSLRPLLASAKVSGFYHHIYNLKQQSIKSSVLRLDRLLSRHNFYDLETALEIENKDTKQKALWLQGEMDCVSDGSDGDRMESFDDYIFKSQHFQPTTSYGWSKVTDKVNPLVPRLEAELADLKAKLPSASASEKKAAEARIAEIPRIVADLRKRSYLIAQEDPFVVIPMSFRNYKGSNAYTPGIGDYAAVICGDRIFPAIVGDYGPSEKCGEASLRIARELDPSAGPYKRPISDLKVSYLIFPDSGVKPAQPDYDAWHDRCAELLTKLGADPAKLHRWENRLAPKPDSATTTNPDGTAATPAPDSPPQPDGDLPASEKANPVDPVRRKP